MMNRVESAKLFVRNMFAHSCTYDDIRAICSSYDDHYDRARRCTLCAGSFRSVIIPDGADYIIKTGANGVGSRQCKREFSIYNKAVRAGVADSFATIYGYFCYHNHVFYVMEKLADVGAGDYDFVDLDECPENVANFIDDNYINDTHYGNYGFRNGLPVLCDYAGWDAEHEAMERW